MDVTLKQRIHLTVSQDLEWRCSTEQIFCEFLLVWLVLVYVVLRAFRSQAFKHHFGIGAVVDAVLIYPMLSDRETD